MTEPEPLEILSNEWRRERVRRGDAALNGVLEIVKLLESEEGSAADLALTYAMAGLLIQLAQAYYAAANVRR